MTFNCTETRRPPMQTIVALAQEVQHVHAAIDFLNSLAPNICQNMMLNWTIIRRESLQNELEFPLEAA